MRAAECCPACHRPFVTALALTRRQVDLLRYLDASIRENGFAPSFDEIAAQFGYRSLATVHEHLQNLQRKGVISRAYNESRAITVLVRPDELGATV